MAEKINNGYIEITRAEAGMAVLVESATVIECPVLPFDAIEWCVYISKHGIVDDDHEWLSITPKTQFNMMPPFYVMSKYACRIPCLTTIEEE